jgi:Mrp family chromosome partitioning ATPase
MIKKVKLKKGSVIVVTTPNRMPAEMAEKVIKELREMFPDNKVLMPNGAEIIILEQE